MGSTKVNIKPIAVKESGLEQKFSVSGDLFSFRNLSIFPTDTIPENTDTAIPSINNYDVIIDSAGKNATGTITIASVDSDDTVTINGLVYTGVSGTKADNTEFTITGTDTAVAIDLTDSINNDTRSGTLGDVVAANTDAVVTVTSDQEGTNGNAVTLISSDGVTLAVSGSGFFTGGAFGPANVDISARGITVDESSTFKTIPTFFTNIFNDTDSALTVIPKVNRNGIIDYDVFWSASGTGPVTGDLTVGTIEIPEGATLPTFPFFPNTFDPLIVTYVSRATKGTTRVYDYFMVSTQ